MQVDVGDTGDARVALEEDQEVDDVVESGEEGTCMDGT